MSVYCALFCHKGKDTNATATNCKVTQIVKLKICSAYLKQKVCTKRAYTERARTKIVTVRRLKRTVQTERRTKQMHKYTLGKCEQLSQFLILHVQTACLFHKRAATAREATFVLSQITSLINVHPAGTILSGGPHLLKCKR